MCLFVSNIKDDAQASSIHAHHVMSVLVTVLCNQPEAFALDLGDDQSHYLLHWCRDQEFN